MATPILPTPPLRGKDAKAVLRALAKKGASDEEMARRIEESRKRLESVMGVFAPITPRNTAIARRHARGR